MQLPSYSVSDSTTVDLVDSDAIDREGRLPVFEQVTDILRRRIQAGHYGERLPSVREVAAGLRCSSSTVIKALRILQAEGLVSPRHGMAWTVVPREQRPHDAP